MLQPSIDSTSLPHFLPGRSCTEASLVTSRLVGRGITLRQLLSLYFDPTAVGRFREGMKTREVVREIIIPLTTSEHCAFMESSFMSGRGGKHPAHKLISHWWGAEFLDTVVSAAMDAFALDFDEVHDCMASTCPIEELEGRAGSQALDIVYWLCICAVNQHLSICGTAWNPCACGSLHFSSDDPRCEMDKFDRVMAQLPGGIVVASGPDLGALQRIWCLAEISTALHLDQPITFCLSRGVTEQLASELASGQPVVPRV